MANSAGPPESNSRKAKSNPDLTPLSAAQMDELIARTLDKIKYARVRISRTHERVEEELHYPLDGYNRAVVAALSKADDAIRSARLTANDAGIIRKIQRFIDLVVGQLEAFSTIDSKDLNKAIEHLSKITNSAERIEAAAYELLKNALEVSESQRKQFSEITMHTRHMQLKLDRSVKLASDAIESYKVDLGQSNARLAALNERAEEFLSTQAALMRTELEGMQAERLKATTLAQEDFAKALLQAKDDERVSAESHVRQIEQILDKAKLAASKVAHATISSYYSRSADRERVSARIWSITAVLLGLIISGLVLTVIILSIFHPVETTFASALRILAPLIGSPLFIYATLESRQHRKRAWSLDDAAITHSTLNAMIAPLPQEMQHGVIYKAANRLYVQEPVHTKEVNETFNGSAEGRIANGSEPKK